MDQNEKLLLTIAHIKIVAEETITQHFQKSGDLESLIDLHCEGWFPENKVQLRDDIRAMVDTMIPTMVEKLITTNEQLKKVGA